MKAQTVCFTGHRVLPQEHVAPITRRLEDWIGRLHAKGFTRFVSGGALGFDQLAAEAVLRKRDGGLPIQLIIVKPCQDQDARWTPAQRERYAAILKAADEVICLAPHYAPGCMQARNRYMVDGAGLCVSCQSCPGGGTAQTVAYAQKKGVSVYNIWL